MNKRVQLGVVLFALVLLADQLSKQWILQGLKLQDIGRVELLPILELVMVWNHGITFGIFNGSGLVGPLVLGAVALAIVIGLLIWLRKAETFWIAGSLGAIAGGAVGNVVDRVRYGAVVDFLHLHAGNWDPFRYVFNIGDSAIVCGVAVLLIDGMLPSHRRGKQGKQAP